MGDVSSMPSRSAVSCQSKHSGYVYGWLYVDAAVPAGCRGSDLPYLVDPNTLVRQYRHRADYAARFGATLGF